MKLHHALKVADFLSQKVPTPGGAGCGPVRNAHAADKLITLELPLEFAAPTFRLRARLAAAAFRPVRSFV
ncbi:MAG: hypothetical protein WKF37_22985 [Bryobacteraceae bacterium]